MNVNKRIVAGIVIVTVVVALAVKGLSTKSGHPDSAKPAVKSFQNPLHNTQSEKAISKMAAAEAYSTTTPTSSRPVPPVELENWFSMKESQRLDLVTKLQHNSTLKPEVVTFLISVVQDRQRYIVTRNNAANALVNQEIKDPSLAMMFKRMVEDVSETEQWRDYALQFLAVSVDWSDDPQAMTATIWHMATEGPGSIPGTAFLHLHYIDQRGVAQLPLGYVEHLSKMLDQESADLPSRMTVAGIIGQRQMIELAPQLRKVAEHASQPALRRVALAALGNINDPADIAFVQRFTSDADVLIAAAAKGAEKRLLAANQKTSQAKP